MFGCTLCKCLYACVNLRVCQCNRLAVVKSFIRAEFSACKHVRAGPRRLAETFGPYQILVHAHSYPFPYARSQAQLDGRVRPLVEQVSMQSKLNGMATGQPSALAANYGTNGFAAGIQIHSCRHTCLFVHAICCGCTMRLALSWRRRITWNHVTSNHVTSNHVLSPCVPLSLHIS